MQDVAIPEVSTEDLGPAMLSLNPRQRKFVVGWIGARGKNAARVARAAGYSDHLEAAKVRAHELLHNPRITRALHEEAGRRLDGMAAIAVAVLEQNMASSVPKVRQAAVDSVLDRTGYARRTEQAVQINDKRVPQKTYEQLVAAVAQKLLQHKVELPVIEAQFEEVTVAQPATDGS